jgi:hypothetical protein
MENLIKQIKKENPIKNHQITKKHNKYT